MRQTTPHARAAERPSRVLSGIIDFLRRNAPFSGMESGHLDFLAKRLQTRYFPVNSRILCGEEIGGACLLIVKQGLVQGLERDHTPMQRLVPGNCFVVTPARIGERDRTEYLATEDTFCLEVEAETLAELLKKSRALKDFLAVAQPGYSER